MRLVVTPYSLEIQTQHHTGKTHTTNKFTVVRSNRFFLPTFTVHLDYLRQILLEHARCAVTADSEFKDTIGRVVDVLNVLMNHQ